MRFYYDRDRDRVAQNVGRRTSLEVARAVLSSDRRLASVLSQDCREAGRQRVSRCLGTPHEAVNGKLLEEADWGGMLLLGTGMTLICSGLDQGNPLDWLESGTVVALLGGGGVLTASFFVNKALVCTPWAHAKILLSRNIGLSQVVILLYTLTGLSNSSPAPDFLTAVAQLRPKQTGSLFLTFAVLPMILTMPLSVWAMKRIDARIVTIAGLSAFAVAGLLGIQITHDWSLNDFEPMVLLQSFGQALTLFPAIVIALSNSDPARATAFSAYVQVTRLGGAEIGVALMGTWLRVREQVHSNLLGQHLASGSSEVTRILAQISGQFAGHGEAMATARGLSSLSALIQREANIPAYIDGFRLTVWFAIAALACVALIGSAPMGPFTPEAKQPQCCDE